MGATEIAAAVLFFLTVSGALWGIWWKIDGRVKEAQKEATAVASGASAKADFAMMQLAEYKTHAAETYATKAGMQEQTSQLLRAIEGVANRIDSVHERLDRALDRSPARRS